MCHVGDIKDQWQASNGLVLYFSTLVLVLVEYWPDTCRVGVNLLKLNDPNPSRYYQEVKCNVQNRDV
jgi:hypothetical protein